MGIMLAGEIGVGGPIAFAMCISWAWKVTFSQSARRTVSPVSGDFASSFFQQDLVLIAFGIIVHLRSRLRRQRCRGPGHYYLRLRTLNECCGRKIHGSRTHRNRDIGLLLVVG